MGMFKEFKEFALKGNLIDLAVAVVIGAAFTKVVNAFIDGMIMPLVSLLTGGVNFSDRMITLKAASKNEAGEEVAAVMFKYGQFITVAVEFLIVAFVVFLVIKAINSAKKKQAEAPVEAPAPSASEVLLAEIRDALKK